jgi:outer membrane scaffolding protein for murein synthesis (MipA/OmpV family)
VPVRAAFNLSDGFKYEGLTLNPQLSYERRSPEGWSYEASVGPVLADQQYQANYYQVDPEFATANRAAYKAKAGLLSWRANLGVSKTVSPQLRLLGAVRYETVNGAANQDSPLVKEKNGFSFFLGLDKS